MMCSHPGAAVPPSAVMAALLLLCCLAWAACLLLEWQPIAVGPPTASVATLLSAYCYGSHPFAVGWATVAAVKPFSHHFMYSSTTGGWGVT